MKTKKQLALFAFFLLFGFLLRIYFTDKFIKESGDLLLYADWGKKFWELGAKNFYYVNEWYYAPPNYPPLLSLIYGGSYWLYDHKYVLAQVHNIIRFPPSIFIIYFYDHGYELLLKFPGILADIGLTVLIYKIVFITTRSLKRSVGASLFYLFNPVSVFLSGIWGQSDSLVAFFGILSFYTLFLGKTWISLPLLFTSFYIKPNWGLFIPVYLFIFFSKKPKLKDTAMGVLICTIIFLITTMPFSKGNIVTFLRYLLDTRILPTATVSHKASVSAFNFWTIFFELDKTSDKVPFAGIPANILGLVSFTLVNILSFGYLKKQKYTLESIMSALFSVGFSGYLFLTNMLERYFFASFVPLIIVTFTNPKLLSYSIAVNVVTFLNLVYAFFRRTIGEIADFFIKDNFLVIRFLSSLSTVTYMYLLLEKISLVKTK